MEFNSQVFEKRIRAQFHAASANGGDAGMSVPRQTDALGCRKMINISKLHGISDEDLFLKEAYALILGRACDEYGLLHYRQALRKGVPRQIILEWLISSDEAQQRHIRFKGLILLRNLPRTIAFRARMIIQTTLRKIIQYASGLVGVLIEVPRYDLMEGKLDVLTEDAADRWRSLMQTCADLQSQFTTFSTETRATLRTLPELLRQHQIVLREELQTEWRLISSADRALAERQSIAFAGLRDRLSEVTHAIVPLQQQIARVATIEIRLDSLATDVCARKDEHHATFMLQAALTRDCLTEITKQCQSIRLLEKMLVEMKGSSALAAGKLHDDMNENVATGVRIQNVLASLSRQQGAVRCSMEDLAKRTADIAGLMDANSPFMRAQQACIEEQHLISQTLIELASRLESQVLHHSDHVSRGGGNVSVTQWDGLMIGVPAEDWRMAAYHAFRGMLEPGLVELIKRSVRTGMVVVDVGANVGVYTLIAARLVGPSGKVFSFEPTPHTFSILKENVQLNGFLESGAVNLHCIAVTDRTDTRSLWVHPGNCGHNTLFESDTASSAIEVETVSLDTVLGDEPRIDIVKIDVEGAERLVLQGMQKILMNNPQIQVFMEYAPTHLRRAGVDGPEFLNSLRSKGFNIKLIDDLTGELTGFAADQPLAGGSVNLLLSRPGVNA